MEFPELAHACSHPGCLEKNDFLPFTCNGCNKKYCLEHHRHENHSCPVPPRDDKYAPTCPLCMQAVTIMPGQDANQVIDKHIRAGCPTEQIKTKKNSCTFKGCREKEFIPISCKLCKKPFCLKHRFEADHDCPANRKPGQAPQATSSSTLSAAAKAAASRASSQTTAARPVASAVKPPAAVPLNKPTIAQIPQSTSASSLRPSGGIPTGVQTFPFGTSSAARPASATTRVTTPATAAAGAARPVGATTTASTPGAARPAGVAGAVVGVGASRPTSASTSATASVGAGAAAPAAAGARPTAATASAAAGARPTVAAARKAQKHVNKPATAEGASGIPERERFLVSAYLPCASGKPPAYHVLNSQWTVGKAIDTLASRAGVRNENNKPGAERLYLFNQAGARLNNSTSLENCVVQGMLSGGAVVILEYGETLQNHDPKVYSAASGKDCTIM